MSRPAVSVVVPAGPGDLAAALAAVARLELRDGDELLVADNGGGAPAAAAGRARVIGASGPASSYFARARAAAVARGDWLVFLDADCEPDPGLLDAYFDPPPGERTAVLAGAIEDAVVRPTLVARYVAARRKLDQAHTLGHPRPYAQTANCAVLRSAFEAAGGFPDPVRSGGDADLCWRLAGAGWALERRPGARVRHRSRETLGALLAQMRRHGAGMQWLQGRWPDAFPPPRPRELTARLALPLRGPYGALDFACAWARDVGRLRANGDPTPPT